jgi:tRNA (cytidine/uridine-2'-O-)-methyltransferase
MNDAPQHSPDFRPINPPLRIVLVEPDIPPNTGNIARLCAAASTPLHLVEPLGFRLTDKAMKRAGLDYWEHVELQRHRNFQAFERDIHPPRTFLFSTKGTTPYWDITYAPGDALVFGSETRGLSEDLLASRPANVLTIPMSRRHVRSLNLANSVSIVLYEALRQLRNP